MSDQDDREYRRNARNMALVLTAIVITVFAALLVPPLLNPIREQFSPSGSAVSPYGFSLNLQLNATLLSPGESVSAHAWLNSTSAQVNNVTSANAWPVGPAGLLTKFCTTGWPLGVGVMQGYYTLDNYSQGSLIRIPMPLLACPQSIYSPQFFVFPPHSQSALVSIGGNPERWDLQTTLVFSGAYPGQVLASGVYTAVCADEWGDIVVAHFRVSQ